MKNGMEDINLSLEEFVEGAVANDSIESDKVELQRQQKELDSLQGVGLTAKSNQAVIDEIQNLDFPLLPEEAKEMIAEMPESGYFEELLTDHTQYQIKNFIIGQFITDKRKERQTRHEGYSRLNGIVSLQHDYEKHSNRKRKIQWEIDQLKKKQESFWHRMKCSKFFSTFLLPGFVSNDGIQFDIDRKEHAIKVIDHQLAGIQRQAIAAYRELREFYAEFKRLQSEGKEKDWNYEEVERKEWILTYIGARMNGAEHTPTLPIEDRKIAEIIINELQYGAFAETTNELLSIQYQEVFDLFMEWKERLQTKDDFNRYWIFSYIRAKLLRANRLPMLSIPNRLFAEIVFDKLIKKIRNQQAIQVLGITEDKIYDMIDSTWKQLDSPEGQKSLKVWD